MEGIDLAGDGTDFRHQGEHLAEEVPHPLGLRCRFVNRQQVADDRQELILALGVDDPTRVDAGDLGTAYRVVRTVQQQVDGQLIVSIGCLLYTSRCV